MPGSVKGKNVAFMAVCSVLVVFKNTLECRMSGLTNLSWEGDNVSMNKTDIYMLLNMFLVVHADDTVIC